MTEAEKLAERLKVAEEIIKCNLIRNSFDLPDMSVHFDLAAQRYMARRLLNNEGKNTDWSDEGFICMSADKISVVLAARAKLREEAEAAMSPRERKYKEALERIERHLSGVYASDHVSLQIARKALES